MVLHGQQGLLLTKELWLTLNFSFNGNEPSVLLFNYRYNLRPGHEPWTSREWLLQTSSSVIYIPPKACRPKGPVQCIQRKLDCYDHFKALRERHYILKCWICKSDNNHKNPHCCYWSPTSTVSLAKTENKNSKVWLRGSTQNWFLHALKYQQRVLAKDHQ